MENAIHNLKNYVSPKSEEVVIFGACRAGLYHFYVFEKIGIKTAFFIDNSAKKIANKYLGKDVYNVELGVKKSPKATFVLGLMNGSNIRKAKAQLISLGISEDQIKYATPDVIPLYIGLFSERKINLEKYEKHKWELLNDIALTRNPNLAPSFTLIVTERCNLSCENCMAFVPHNSKPETFDADDLIESVRKYASGFEYVYRVCLMGGEPFLHKHFAKIVAGIAEIDNILFIDIATNGTVVPPPGLMTVLKKYGLGIEISDYGVTSRKMPQLFQECETRGIIFYHQDYSKKQWVELGVLPKQNRDERVNTTRFLECSQYQTNHIVDGKLHRCIFSAMTDKLGYIDANSDDYVDLLNGNPETTPKAARELLQRNSALAACDICMGLDRERVPCGVQPKTS